MSTAAVPAGAMHRYIALDSLRGVAALGVVLYHIGDFGWIASSTIARSSWLLVDFFFVLSGFVIAASYGGRLAEGFPRGRFLLLRVGRLLPLHLLVVAVFTIAEFAIFRPVLNEPHSLGLLARGLPLLDGFMLHAGNFYAPVSWSISVELVMYIGAALLFGTRRIGIALAALAVVVASVVLLNEAGVIGFGRLLQRGLIAFPLGVLAHALHRRLCAHAGRVPGWGLAAAEVLVMAALLYVLWLPGKTIIWIPLLDGLFLLLVLVFAADAGPVSRLLRTAPLMAIGRWSYSIYMTHLILVIALNRGLPHLFMALGREEWVRPGRNSYGLMSVELGQVWETALTLALVAAALGLSALTWRHVEEPARQWSRRLMPRRSGAEGTAGALPVT